MIEEEQLDGLLAVMRYHNVNRNQDFDTDWISDLSEERIQEMVVTLSTYGYITYKKVSREYHTANLCRLTPEGMKDQCKNLRTFLYKFLSLLSKYAI